MPGKVRLDFRTKILTVKLVQFIAGTATVTMSLVLATGALEASTGSAAPQRDLLDYVDVFGTPLAALIALITAILAATRQARLNRMRDNRLRNKEAESLAIALLAEIDTNRVALKQLHSSLNEMSQGQDEASFTPPLIPLKLPKEIYQSNVSKLGLLHPNLVRRIVGHYSNLLFLEKLTEDLTTRKVGTAAPKKAGVWMTLHVMLAGIDSLRNDLVSFAEGPAEWKPPAGSKTEFEREKENQGHPLKGGLNNELS